MKSASCGHINTSADTDGKSASSDMICLNNITDHGHEETLSVYDASAGDNNVLTPRVSSEEGLI